MDINIPSGLRFGHGVAFVWAGHSIVWQFALFFADRHHGVPFFRFVYFALKPLVLAVLIANGQSWAKAVVGVVGLLEGIACVVIGLLMLEETYGIVLAGGGLIYAFLAFLVLSSRASH